MKFEHFALNVPDVRAAASWYVDELGLVVLRAREDAPFTHFLGDDSGRVFLELYSNPSSPFPDYVGQHPLSFHFAFVATEAVATSERLVEAGAMLYKQEPQPDGSMLVMMRDPWGVPFQLCQRAKPF